MLENKKRPCIYGALRDVSRFPITSSIHYEREEYNPKCEETLLGFCAVS